MKSKKAFDVTNAHCFDSQQAHVYSLAMTLFSASDYNLPATTQPALGADLERLLATAAETDPLHRLRFEGLGGRGRGHKWKQKQKRSI